MAQYGEVRVDFITYTTGESPNEGNVTVPVSGLINTPTFSGSIVIEGDLTVSGDITATGGDLTIVDIDVLGNATVSGDAFVSGDATFSGDVTIASGLVVNTIEAQELFVSGDSTFSGDVNISGTLVASGDISTSGDITAANVTGLTSVSGGVLYAGGVISGETDGGVYGSGYWKIPAGTTAEQPGTAELGMIRYNTTIAQFEGYDGNWNLLGGGATGSGGDRVFVLNETGVTTDYTLTGFNASSAGPITIEDGVEVIIADPFNWAVV
jgi:cytoskeletal protein CcmA (bactofilin family)